jgi:valyl-tRNA synthetase
MDRFEAREAIVQWFRGENLLEQVRDYAHEVGHSYRSHVPIEPYLSDQWYVAVKRPISNFKFQISDFQCETETRDGIVYIKDTDVPVNSLAGLALAPLMEGRLKFYPDRYSKTYQTWLENLRDWPISRQLWWGHQIPVWYLPWEGPVAYGPTDSQVVNLDMPFLTQNEKQHVATHVVRERSDGRIFFAICVEPEYPIIEEKLMAFGATRDDDVLDTWFSSALWPFSTLGWPDETDALKTFYPTQVLCTAREIITLWVSRMVMMGQYCAGDIPFSDVYIHAMIQDGQGRKMSKSLGNGIDPLVAIDSHGADAMRFTLASMTTDTQDVRMPVAPLELPDGRTVNTSPKFDLGRSFCNKLWNASRFAMMNLEGTEPAAFDAAKMDMTDRWILSRLARTIKATTEALDGFKFNEPINELYRFFWNDFCDWYLEWSKPRMQERGTAFQAVGDDGAKETRDHGQDARATIHGQDARATAQNVLAFVLDQTLRLLHPFVPFITEGIYQNLNGIAPRRGLKGIADLSTPAALMAAPWPERMDERIDEACEKQIDLVQRVIRAIRDIRSQYNIAPSRPVEVSASAPGGTCALLTAQSSLIGQLAGVSAFRVSATLEKPANAAAAIVEDVQLYVHDVIDPEAERVRLQKQKEFIENGLRPLQAKLGNENFISRAKPEVVEQTRQKINELAEQLAAVNKHLAELGA